MRATVAIVRRTYGVNKGGPCHATGNILRRVYDVFCTMPKNCATIMSTIVNVGCKYKASSYKFKNSYYRIELVSRASHLCDRNPCNRTDVSIWKKKVKYVMSRGRRHTEMYSPDKKIFCFRYHISIFYLYQSMRSSALISRRILCLIYDSSFTK